MKKKMLLVGLSCALMANLGGCQNDNPWPDGEAKETLSVSLSDGIRSMLESTLLVGDEIESIQEDDDREKKSEDDVAKGMLFVTEDSKSQKEGKDNVPKNAEKSAKQQNPDVTSSQNKQSASGEKAAEKNLLQDSKLQENAPQGNMVQGDVPQGNLSQGNMTQENVTQGNTFQEPMVENDWQPEPEPVVEVISNATAADSEQVAQKVLEYINSYRSSPATSLSGLGGYARYRSRQLVSNFSHDTNAERAAATALCYGEYVDPSVYGMSGDPYYTAGAREAIAKGGYVGTVDEVAENLAQLIKNSSGHWNYVGSSDYPYIAVGVTYEGGTWYCDVAVTMENTDNK